MSCPLTPAVKQEVVTVGHCAGCLVSDRVGKPGCTQHTQWLLAQVQQAALTPGSKPSARCARAAPVLQAATKSESQWCMSQLLCVHVFIGHMQLPCAVQLDCHEAACTAKDYNRHMHSFNHVWTNVAPTQVM